MNRAEKALQFQYDPERVKKIIDHEIDSDMAAGKWVFSTGDLIGYVGDEERARDCLEEVQKNLEAEGFCVLYEELPGQFPHNVFVLAEHPEKTKEAA